MNPLVEDMVVAIENGCENYCDMPEDLIHRAQTTQGCPYDSPHCYDGDCSAGRFFCNVAFGVWLERKRVRELKNMEDD